MSYRPLPEGVTVAESSIEGLGLFATEPLSSGTKLGTSHVFMPDCEDPEERVLRTPVGGFINHSETPNCVKIEAQVTKGGRKWTIFTSSAVEAGDELTVEYTLYSPSST